MILVIITVLFFGGNVFAFEKEDTTLDFKAALMDSNKDYNQKAKVILDQENDRIESWGRGERIPVEIPVEIPAGISVDTQETGALKTEESIEVSMNEY